MEQITRVANFSSSAIHNLMANGRSKDSIGKPFFTYVNQKRWERMAGRQLDNEAHSKPLDWGNMCEQLAFEKMGLEYQIVSKDRYKHPELPWSGCPDLLTDETVGDIKCPWTLNAFFQIYDRGEATLKEVAPAYYWQLISNAILTGKNKCELNIFMPNMATIEEIQELSFKSGKYWFHKNELNELPWTKDLPEITKIEFEPDDYDVALLTSRVKQATELLNK